MTRLPLEPQISSPRSFVRMVWLHKGMVFLVACLLSIAGLGTVSLLPDVYRAESLILVDAQKIPERFVAPTVEVSLQDHLSTVSQQVLSATQMEKLIRKFHLYPRMRGRSSPEQIVERMRQDIQITPEKSIVETRAGSGFSGAFRVAYEGTDPVVVASVVNEISDLLIASNLKAREARAESTSEFIEDQLREARARLEQQEANFSRFRMERMGELPEQEAALTGALSRLQSELQGTQDAISRAEQNRLLIENTQRLIGTTEAAISRAVQRNLPHNSSQPPIEGPGTTPSPVPSVGSVELQARLDDLRTRYHDAHPEVKRLKGELEAVLQYETRLHQAVSELDARKADRQRILRSIAEYQAKLERLPMREQELAAITRDYEISKENYKSLLDKKITAQMAKDMERRQQAAQFTIQDPARVPVRPVKPKRMMLNLSAIGAALGLGIFTAILVELRKGYLLGEWELPPSMPVLGRVPRITISLSAALPPARQRSNPRHV